MRRGERGRALCVWMGHGPSTQHRCRSPTAPPGRRWSGCERVAVAEGGPGRPVVSAQRRALGLRVDSVISFVNPIIRHTDSREQDTSVTRASFTRTLVTAPPPGTRWANIWPKPARGPRVPAAISPLRSPWRAEPRAPGGRPRARAHRSRTPRRRTDRERNERKRPNGSRARPTLPTLGTCCSLAPPRARRRPGRATCD